MRKVICQPCLDEEVEEPGEARSRGMCPKHYQRAKRAGAFDQPEVEICPRCIADDEEDKRPVQVRGMCRRHYLRARKSGELDTVYAPKNILDGCSADECTRPVKARGLCAAHYARRYRGGDPSAPLREKFGPDCSVDECDRAVHGQGLCGTHYWQKRNGKPFSPPRKRHSPGGPCGVAGCKNKAAYAGLCSTHYARRRNGEANWDRPIAAKAPHGSGHLGKDGYRWVYHEGRSRAEHCVFAEQLLGRPLREHENVHHVNGHRADNRTDGPFVLDDRGRLRSGNLEVWSTAQPAGQEIEPKLGWAVEMQEEYLEFLRPEYLERLAGVLRSRGFRVEPGA